MIIKINVFAGATASHQQNMSPTEYTPRQGFLMHFFPGFTGHTNYMPPIVVLKFNEATLLIIIWHVDFGTKIWEVCERIILTGYYIEQ